MVSRFDNHHLGNWSDGSYVAHWSYSINALLADKTRAGLRKGDYQNCGKSNIGCW